MTRVLSGAVLIVMVVGLVWLAPPLALLGAALVLVGLGAIECVHLARASGLTVSMPAATVAALLSCAAVGGPAAGLSPLPLSSLLMAAVVAIGALTVGSWRGEPHALAGAAAGLFPALYLGIPIGTLVIMHASRGPGAVFLLLVTVIVSDTAQYYTGRAFGTRPLAPAISPGKTIEGAVGGFVFGTAALVAGAPWWLPDAAWWLGAGTGVAVVAVGITGDLFESVLKRSAGVKDSSALIPGHGGVLDRIDALLFAAPVYYLLLVAA